jgi:hypothetical protein
MALKEETGAGLESFSTRALDAEVIFFEPMVMHHASPSECSSS